nr:unnamed protein product [Trichobilharzia regenti]CAH8869042.1 unnamed protein product [Trichobilharzia regenti]
MSQPNTASYENAIKAAEHIKKQIRIVPEIGIICGSGLGNLADGIEDKTVIRYEDIPNFLRTSVVGHAGNLVFGKLGKRKVVAMQGRFHMYEGYSKEQIALPIRVLKFLGVKVLIVSNACGGLNRGFKCGDFMVIKDHISLPGLALNNVLMGSNEEKFGPRFLATSNAYSSEIRKLAIQLAEKMNIRHLVHEGVYAFTGGPTYESPAECKMLLAMGADVAGMSTVPEVLIARHCGMTVFAVSLVTNVCILDVESKAIANHEEVIAIAKKSADILQSWIKEIISNVSIDN